MMTFLLQLKFRSRLLLLLAAPLLGLLFFSANRVLDKFAVLEGVKVLHASADLSVKLSRTIHELQKERGMSSGFLASRGEKFRAELAPQRAATDQTLNDLQAHLAGAALPAVLNENLAPLRDLMQSQPALRTRIDALDMAPKDSFAAYTRFIEAGLEVVATIARQSNHEELSRQASAYLMFLNAKEYAGRERATLNNVFAQKRFDPETYRRMIAILSAQDAYFKEFGHYAAPAQKAALDGVQQASAAQEVARMRKEALERGLDGEQNTDPGTWFKTITAKIDALKGVEDQLSDHLLATLGVIERDARWSFTIALALTAVTLALSLILSGLIIASLLRELGGEPSYAASVARTIASGDLSAQIAARDGDAHSVVAAIRQMQANLREMIGRVVDIADNIAVSSAQLNSVSADVATRAGHESDAASSIAATTEQLTTIIHQLSSNGEQIHQKTVGTGQLAGSGRNVVETATAQMNELAEMVQRFSESVKELGEQSAHISTIVQTIREIADQTNLLALNAAIEAARAGETGRGFAVVADEVRKLAERTTHATVEIGQTIKVIQTGMNAAVENMTQANSKVGSSAAEVNKAGESMRAIHQAAEQVIRDIGEISDALREQSSASMDLANQAGNIANISHANSVAVEQVSTSSRDLDGLARELKQSVGKFRLA